MLQLHLQIALPAQIHPPKTSQSIQGYHQAIENLLRRIEPVSTKGKYCGIDDVIIDLNNPCATNFAIRHPIQPHQTSVGQQTSIITAIDHRNEQPYHGILNFNEISHCRT